MLVLALFFCSGATALIYEVLWSRYLSLMLGSTVQAQTLVLAVFMGGLAIGNRLFGKRAAAIESPVLTYGTLEMIIGIYAFFFSKFYQAGDFLFVAIGSRIVEFGLLVALLKLTLSVFLLLLPTVLMGGTLPLLAAWIQRQESLDTGARVGIFYAVNSLGAVAGAGVAGFLLVQRLGMTSSLELTALFNVAIGLVALIAGKRESLLPGSGTQRVSEAPVTPATAVQLPFNFALLVALTGGTSMGLEVLYARALALIVGGSLQAFALVLMSFILGIGLGSVAISLLRAVRKHGVATIYALLILAGVFVAVNVIFIELWTVLYSQARFGLAANTAGYWWHQFGVAAMAFIVLGIPAALLGAVVPLSIRLIENSGVPLGDQVGRLLTANTLGAVGGVLVTGFVLMPLAGLRGALATLSIGLFAICALLAFQREQTRAMIGTVVVAALALAGISSTGEHWRQILGAGVFRVRTQAVDLKWLLDRTERTSLLFYKDSADATVSVEKGLQPGGQTVLRINGKTDASSRGDLSTQLLLAHLPMMARPDAKKAFVLGFGSGITAGALLGHPLEQITIAENCGPVLEAGQFFEQWNRGVLTNNRVRVFNEDARAVLKLRPEYYDVIISEPSNPWVVGIGSVFSQEFYELAARRLTADGMMAQWFHKYEMNDAIILLVIRTFATVFPHMEIWDTQDGDIVLLGSKKPWPSSPAHYQKIFERAEPRKDLARVNLRSAVSVWARQMASQKTAFAIPGDGPRQSDDVPLLEYNAPRAFFLASQAEVLYAFDERTLQYPLIDREKLTVLKALPEQIVLDVFDYFGSANAEITGYVMAVIARREGKTPTTEPANPVVFRPPDYYPQIPGTNGSPQYLECLKLTFQMLRDESKWRESIAGIQRVLSEMIATNAPPSDFKPAYFAAMAARFAIGHKDYIGALQSLKLGFVFTLEDPQLLYLSRVMDRLVDPETVKSQAARQP